MWCPPVIKIRIDASGQKTVERVPDKEPRKTCSHVHLVDNRDGQHTWACRLCDWSTVTQSNQPPRHTCKHRQAARLGDRVELALKAIGITEDRWKATKQLIGLPPTCGCKSRKAWLNKLDGILGLSDKLEEVKGALGWRG